LFTQVNLVSVAGDDFPKKYIDFLKKKDLVLESLMIKQGKTFRWEGEYRGSQNKAVSLKTELGVLTSFKPRISESQRWIKYLFLANLDPDIQRFILRQMRSLKLVGLDSMDYWMKNKRKSLLKILKEVDIYTANETEALELSGESNLINAARSLRRMGPAMVIIKKGEHGVLFCCDEFIFSLPAYPVENLIDPTGAGDAFAGGFMGYLAKVNRLTSKDIKRAIAYGVVIASFNVECFGLERTCRLNLKQVKRRLSNFKKLIEF
jgi:sugar/nucleoside kinase (ribokinase family)